MQRSRLRWPDRRPAKERSAPGSSPADLRLARRRLSAEIRSVVEGSAGSRSTGRKEIAAPCVDAVELSTVQLIKEAMELGFSMHELMRAEQELEDILE
ncbi:hypothetical protein U9M48_034958 [Paspalum notatum var. saurae]|uniref:Uncharacterized protein n=1 Tax=Paspalum notatum var. saurae TaxID=547442 RepID=A0AAQ3X9H9_PASNO